jgi:hypothetical protein
MLTTALRDSYSWRHRFASQLEDMTKLKPDRQRFMTGHAAPDVHGKVYLKHPPAKLKPFIDALPDPTIPAIVTHEATMVVEAA